jgi:multiple sugar transport system permease protein
VTSRTGRPGRSPLAAESRWAWLFLAPTLIGLAVLSAGPIIAALGISLTKWDLLTAPRFIGLDNFATLLSDRRFLTALRNTAFYTATSVPIGLVLGLALALALNQRLRGISWIRTAYFLPVVTSTVAISLVWSWIYSPDSGPLNGVLGAVGIPAQRWIADPFWAMPSIVAMSVWQGLGTTVIIFLAGLQGIPEEYYDAAAVDGAGPRARFRFVTGILALIDSFQVFDQVYVLARPGKATEATITIVYTIYENGFQNFKMGYAAASAWILVLIVAILTAVYFRLQNRWVHYQ